MSTETRTFRAPGRVNLIGEHTDYNDGFVMPAAIDFYTWATVSPREDRKLQIRSANFDEEVEVDLDDPNIARRKHWSDYPVGVAVILEREGYRFLGARVGIMDQFVSLFGQEQKALLLDCRSLDFRLLPLPDNVRLIICNTMVKHALASNAYNERREQCEAGVKHLAKFLPDVRALR